MADPTRTLIWLEDRLRQEEQAIVLRHQELLRDLRQWKLDAPETAGSAGQQEASLAPQDSKEARYAETAVDMSHEDRQEAESPPVDAAAGSEEADAPGPPSSSHFLSSKSMKDHVQLLQSKLATKADRLTHDEDADIEATGLARIVYDWHFEAFFALLIVFNALVIGSEVQYRSYGLGWMLGWIGAPDEPGGPFEMQQGTLFFQVIDVIFGALFWLELILKMVVMKSSFLTSLWSLVDLAIMLLWTLDIIIVNAIAIPPTVLRILRLIKLMRLVRFVKTHDIFDTLILMMSCVKKSAWVLLWSICLLVSIMLLVALIMNSTLEWHMLDETTKIETRLSTYKYFGSFSRSMVSMFEITLGNWVPICRHLMDNVTERYALLIIVYRLLVCEGILKVITAIFIQQTMQCASNDDQLMIENKMRQRERFFAKMNRLLQEMDTSGDGLLTREEFTTILANPRVKMWLSAMELNVRDADMLFTMLDKSGDGRLDVQELVAGMSALKGPATQLHMESTENVILKHLQSIEGSMLWLQNAWPRILEQTSRAMESGGAEEPIWSVPPPHRSPCMSAARHIPASR